MLIAGSPGMKLDFSFVSGCLCYITLRIEPFRLTVNYQTVPVGRLYRSDVSHHKKYISQRFPKSRGPSGSSVLVWWYCL